MEMELPSYFPHDVVVGILSRLPVKSLLRFRCVCKSFRSLISDPHFVKIHLNQGAREKEKILLSSRIYELSMPLYSTGGLITPLEKIDYAFHTSNNNNPQRSIGVVAGSCNGLLLIVSPDRKTFFLWNPSTRERKEVSNPAYQSNDVYLGLELYGLGNSKLVMFLPKVDRNYVLIYVLYRKTNIWTTRVENYPCLSPLSNTATLLNEILHWVYFSGDDNGYEIICFDLAKDIFNEKIPLPDFRFSPRDFQLSVSRGCLCVVCTGHSDWDQAIEVWVMKEYGVQETWVNIFNVVLKVYNYQLFVLPFTSNEDVVVMDVSGEKLVFCNPETNTCKVIPVPVDEMRLVSCSDGTDFENNNGEIVVTEINRRNFMVFNPETKIFGVVDKRRLVPIPVRLFLTPYTYVESLVSVNGLQ